MTATLCCLLLSCGGPVTENDDAGSGYDAASTDRTGGDGGAADAGPATDPAVLADIAGSYAITMVSEDDGSTLEDTWDIYCSPLERTVFWLARCDDPGNPINCFTYSGLWGTVVESATAGEYDVAAGSQIRDNLLLGTFQPYLSQPRLDASGMRGSDDPAFPDGQLTGLMDPDLRPPYEPPDGTEQPDAAVLFQIAGTYDIEFTSDQGGELFVDSWRIYLVPSTAQLTWSVDCTGEALHHDINCFHFDELRGDIYHDLNDTAVFTFVVAKYSKEVSGQFVVGPDGVQLEGRMTYATSNPNPSFPDGDIAGMRRPTAE